MDKKLNALISVVSPVYQSSDTLQKLIDQLKEVLSSITNSFEIILVNDCSPDNSWEIIQSEAKLDERVIGILLSKNFGQHPAISAGVKHAKGEWIIVMDADLQDNPQEITNLFNKSQEGWDIVHAQRINRKDSIIKRFLSKMFTIIFNYFSGLKRDYRVGNFGVYNRKVINEYNKMPEVARSFPSLINHLGFNSCNLEVTHCKRLDGKSSYTFAKLASLAIDIIISNGNKPLKLAIKIGILLSIISFLIAAYNLIAFYLGLISFPGFTSTIFSIWFVGGINLLFMGVLGLYIDKIFNQVKGRQLYIIKETVNLSVFSSS